jgi:hypothetical protein
MNSITPADINILASLDGQEKLKLGFNIFFGILLTFMLLTSLNFDWRDQFFPLLIGIPTLFLIFVNILFIIRPDIRERYFQFSDESTTSLQEKLAESIEGADTEGHSASERRRYERLLIMWIAILPLAMYLFGMAIVLPVYVFSFVWYFGESNIKRSFLAAVTFSITAYVIFVLFLNYRIPSGILF